MIESNGMIANSIPSKCKNYEPIMDKPNNVSCSKIGKLYVCNNMNNGSDETKIGGCIFCINFIEKVIE